MALTTVSDPETHIRDLAARSGGSNDESDSEFVTAFRFSVATYSNQQAVDKSLVALVHGRGGPSPTLLGLVISDQVDALSDWLSGRALEPATLAEAAARFESPWIDPAAPLPLKTVAVPKPWGREIWYTGIEKRGVCAFSIDGKSLPLPWLLQLAPGLLLGTDTSEPLLLKVLDPVPEPVYGDLYVELHQQKREVYVVTHIDEEAWPDGVGSIRYGFSQARRAQYADEAGFRSAYLAAVDAYREVRREIDRIFDGYRQQEGVGLHEAVPVATLKRWQASLSPALQQREQRLREEMDSFYETLPLRLGDVVKVAPYTPHSLQHGVRTIEFQTPVYERRILSFGQKVLTQDHWDTHEAVAEADIEPRSEAPITEVASGKGYRRERIVDFDQFEAHRLTLEPGAMMELAAGVGYAVAVVVQAQIRVDDIVVEPEQGVFLPAASRCFRLSNPAEQTGILIVAWPHNGAA